MKKSLLLVTVLALVLFSTSLFAVDSKVVAESQQKSAQLDEAKRVPQSAIDAYLGTTSQEKVSASTAIFMEDFEGDLLWTMDSGYDAAGGTDAVQIAAPSNWTISEDKSFSPTHALHIQDEINVARDFVFSPVFTVPELIDGDPLVSAKVAFQLNIDNPGYGEIGTTYLADFLMVYAARPDTTFEVAEGVGADGSNAYFSGYPESNSFQYLTSPDIDLTAAGDTITLKFDYLAHTERTWDLGRVEVMTDAGPVFLAQIDSNGVWAAMQADLSAYQGQTVQVRFSFLPDDGTAIDNGGLWLDNIIVEDNTTGTLFEATADNGAVMQASGMTCTDRMFYTWDINEDGGTDWTEISEATGMYSAGGLTDLFDVGVTPGEEISLVFRYTTDGLSEQGETESAGLFIDDVVVTGVSGIPTDAGVTALFAGYPMTAGQPTVAAAMIKNFGYDPQTAIGLWYQIDEETAMPVPPYVELDPFDETAKLFTFNYPEAMSANVKAYTLLTDDGNPDNDASATEVELEAPGTATFSYTTGDIVYFSTATRASMWDPMSVLQNTPYYNLESIDLLMYDVGGEGDNGIGITVATTTVDDPTTPVDVLYEGNLEVAAGGGVSVASVPIGAQMLTAPVVVLLDYTNAGGNTGILMDGEAVFEGNDFIFTDGDDDGTSEWYFSANGHQIFANTTYWLPPQEIMTFSEDFEAEVDMSFWAPNGTKHEDETPVFDVSQQNGALCINMKQINFPDGQLYDWRELNQVINMTENPLAAMKVKVEPGVMHGAAEVTSLPIQLSPFTILQGAEGDSMVRQSSMTIEVEADGEWHQLYFDFSDFGDHNGDFSAVNAVLLETVKWPDPFTATFCIDDFKLGEAAIVPKQNKPVLPINRAAGPIAIDGALDPVFAHTDWYRDFNIIASSSDQPDAAFNEAAIGWRALYDDNFLYLFVNVTDDSLQNDSANDYQDDSVEFWLDGDNSKNDVETGYDANDFGFTIAYTSDDDPLLFACSNSAIKYAGTTSDGGFFVEAAVPWELLGGQKAAGSLLGIDIDFNDDDNGGDTRETKLKYFSTIDESWRDASSFGTVVLTDKEITPTAPIYYVGTPLVIDGEKDDVLNDEMIPTFHTNHFMNRLDSLASVSDLFYNFNVVWDSSKIYYFVELMDDMLVQDGELNYQDDGFELWLDPDNSKATAYDGVNDFGVAFKYIPGAPIDSVSIWPGETFHTADLVEYAAVQTEKGLNLEFAIPLDSIGVAPVNGWKLGFELDWNDDDNDGGRDTKTKFFAGVDETWQNPSLLDTGVLVGGPGEPVMEEEEVLLAIDKTASAPVIDGVWDFAWDNSRNYKIASLATDDSTASDWWDTYGNFRVLYDDDNFYMFIAVNDDSIYTETGESYEKDNIEIYFDGDNSKNPLDETGAWPPATYDENDEQIRFVYGQAPEAVYQKVDLSNLNYAYSESDSGWALEFALPLDGQPFEADAENVIGFEVSLGDNDGAGRERILKWWADNDEAWHAPEEMGTAVFTDREINEEDLGRVLPVEFTTFPIAVDAEMDYAWNNIAPVFGNYRMNTADSLETPEDLEVCWRATWDYANLYLWVKVMDDILLNESSASSWQDDGFELWFDGDGNQSVSWDGINDNFFFTNFSEETVLTPFAQGKGVEMDSTDLERILQAQKLIPGGIILEAAFPLDLLGIEPGDGSLFALDIDYNDSDTPGLDRDTKSKSYDPTDGTWGNSATMGLARLVGGAIKSSVESEIVVVNDYELRQNYPNPFNPSTTIEFALPEAAMTKLTVYDILGRQIVELVNQRLESGRHTVTFDASMLASGVYFYRLQTPGKVMHKKMMLIK